ncbi:MAG: hypothetical protein WCT27_00285 [Patescibacteria group bacterium]
MPVFFLPVGNFPQELNKTVLFSLVVFIAAAVLMVNMINRRELRFFSHHAFWLTAILFLCILVSVVFSQNHYVSLFGSGGAFSGNGVSQVSFMIFFFLLIYTTRNVDDWGWLVRAFTIAVTAVSLLSVFQIYGLYMLPWTMTHDVRFNLVASSSVTVAIVASLCSIIALSLLWQSRGKYWKIFWGGCVLVQLVLVMLSGKAMATYISLIGLFLFSIAVSWHAKKFSKTDIIAPLAAIILLAAGLLVNFSQLTGAQTSTTLVLDQRSSMDIAWQSIRHSPVWGTGPQTFTKDFQTYRPASFNDLPNAAIRFNKSGSEWWGQLSQLGIVFVAVQIFFCVYFFIRVFKKFISDWQAGGTQWVWSMTVLLVWAGLMAVYFLTPFNFILYFLWWLWLGISFRLAGPFTLTERRLALKPFRFAWLGSLIGITALSCLVAISGYFGVRYWLADLYYFRANELIQKQAPVGDIEALLVMAASYNPHEPGYLITLAQGHATAAQLEAGQSSPDTGAVKSDVQAVVDALKRARETDPDNAMVYEQTASLYDNLRNLIGNADQLAMAAYVKLSELEPTNPIAFLNLGRALLVQAQADSQSANNEIQARSALLLDEAVKNFRISKSLQQDNYLADVNIAYVLQAQGDFVGAKTSAEAAQRIKPDDETIQQLLVDINKQISAGT